MAEIPVHKKSSLAWLWWLLALIVLALLLWWLLADHDNEAVTPVATDATTPLVVDNTIGMDSALGVDNAMVAEPLPAQTDATAAAATATPGGPITDMSTLTGATRASMVGRQVNLRNASVTSVPDDMGFFIGSGPANRVFVTFNEVPSPGQPNKEGQVDVNNGSTVAIQGEVVRNTGTPAPGIKVTLPKGVDTYIRASRVAVVNN